MASGTINGSFSGPSSTDHARPQITWSSTTSVSGNYSNVTATLRFRKWQYWNSWNANGHSVTITINGNSDSESRTFDIRNSNNYVVWSRTVRVNHDSDGSKTIKIGASGNTGVKLGSYNFSGDADLGTIPRASTLSKFSFNANLKNGTSNQINYTVDRKNSGFRHQFQLRDGDTTVHQWDNIDSNGDSTLPLTSGEVNTLLNRMSSSTTKSYTLRVATRSGVNGSWIGSAVSTNATATVDGDVKPSVGSVSVSQTGNPVSDHALQGFSKIKANFTRSAGYGATISSSSIQIRRRWLALDGQTINSNSGTTANPVSSSGVYQARGKAIDSRGRTTYTEWEEFAVTAYSPPMITKFEAVRDSEVATKVNITRATAHTVLGAKNHMTYTVQRRQGAGAWTNVTTGATGTITLNPSSSSSTSTGNSVTQSHEFRYVVEDQLGGRAERIVTVSTQRVVLDIHKDEGVGVGKIHERGVLDVGGEIFSDARRVLNVMDSSLSIAPGVWTTIDIKDRAICILLIGQRGTTSAYAVAKWTDSIEWVHLGGDTGNIETLNESQIRIRMGNYYQYGLVKVN